MDLGGIVVAVVAAIGAMGVAWMNTRAKVKESREQINQNMGNLEEKLVNRMQTQINELTAKWVAANDESDIKNVRIVWLQESLEKCRRDMAHFERRAGERGYKEADT